ncbi:MAG: selenium cofactor biosynthesis protein YqeC [Vicinamibacteria bacterium]
MSLLVPLGIGRGEVVAAVGAGGKTSLLRALAAEAEALGWTVLVTSTTHMGPPRDGESVLFASDGASDEAVRSALRDRGRATLYGRRVREDKLEGVAPERVDGLAGAADLVLVEADGARQRSLKAPAAHEPVVPRSSTLVVVLAALDVLGTAVAGPLVHRPEVVARLTGASSVTEEALAACLCHPRSYPRVRAAGRRLAVFLNKVEDEGGGEAARRIGARLCPPYDLVAAGSARGVAARVG